MKRLAESDNALLLRTDFSDDAAWQAICAAIHMPVDGFYASVSFVDDPAYSGLSKAQILDLFAGIDQSFVFVADRTAITNPEHPLLVIDLFDEEGQEFRTIPSGVQSIENNLSISNMDFEEFASAADEDGVFRGFRRY